VRAGSAAALRHAATLGNMVVQKKRAGMQHTEAGNGSVSDSCSAKIGERRSHYDMNQVISSISVARIKEGT